MSAAPIPKQHLVDVLTEEWSAIDDLLTSLSVDAWSLPTALPGWNVQDVVSHIIGTESLLNGRELPPVSIDVHALPHVRNDIAATNEHWVLAMHDMAPADVLGRYREIVRDRSAALGSMSQADFDAPSWTPVGEATYARFMQIRLFDCWVHEQDIRDAVGHPGREDGRCAEQSIDEMVSALGLIVGKRAGAPDGAAVTIELTGPVRRTIHVSVDGRAKVVGSLDRPATATIRLSSSLFVRLAAGRVDPGPDQPGLELSGDVDLARRVVDHLAFTI